MASPIIDKIPNLVDIYGLDEKFKTNPLMGDNVKRSIFGGGGFLPVRIINIIVNCFKRKRLSWKRMHL